MPILGSQGVTIVPNYIIGGQLCQNVLQYNSGDSAISHTPADIAAAWWTHLGDEFKACLAQATVVLGLDVDATGTAAAPDDYPPFFYSLNQVGTVAAESCPPYVSARLYKLPVNADREPANAAPFQNGMIRLGAVPETFQNAGFASTAGTAAYDALAALLGSFVVGSDVYTMHMGRPPNDVDLLGAVVPVSDVFYSGGFGSQDTRKW